jgi:hypothetical protein
MKVISIKQPWASLIVEGVKPIENRTWPTRFRGRVLIHAGIENLLKKCEFIDDLLTVNQIIEVATKNKDTNIFGCRLNTGAIIGSVEIVDCVQNHSSVWAEHKATVQKKIKGENVLVEVPVYNWVLDKPVLFDKPIENVKGKLSFWEYELPGNFYGSFWQLRDTSLSNTQNDNASANTAKCG